MPIQTTQLDDDLVLCTAIDAITFAELMEVLKQFYEDDPPLNILWDLRQGTAVNLTYDHLGLIVDYVAKFSEKRKRGKTAFVVLRDVDYGIFRTMDTFADLKEVPLTLQAFHDYDEALQWLKNENAF